MEYINEKFHIFKHLVHDGYRAESVQSFLDQKDEVPLPSKWKMLSPLFIFAPELFLDQVLVYFRNVNLRFKQPNYVVFEGDHEIVLQSVTNIITSMAKEYPNFTPGKFSEVVISYDIRTDQVYLHSFRTSDPQHIEQESLDSMLLLI